MKAKCRVTFKPLGRWVDIEGGATILQAAEQAGVHIASDCGGLGHCGKCKVIVDRGAAPPTPLEREFLTEKEIRDRVRLACQTEIRGPVDVSLPVSTPGSEHILEEGISGAVSFQPHVEKRYLKIARGEFKREKSIAAIIETKLADAGIENAAFEFSGLRALPDFLYPVSEGITSITQHGQLLGIEPGNTSGLNYGLAVDVGTTTVVGYLFDLDQGKLMAVDSDLNRQSLHGSDVISRIDFALTAPSGLERLQGCIIDTINHIIRRLCEKSGVSSDHLYCVVIVGNTPMNHLFWGMSPRFLSRAPYNPLTTEPLCVPSGLLGLQTSPFGRILALPLVSGFIGSDTVGVVLSTGLHKSRSPKMAIDIGTNGEIVVTDGKTMAACSCAAGPAFEGAQIQCGMRGADGAVDHVDFKADDVTCRVIGGIAPKGICGSGLVDAIAGLLKTGLITGDGRLLTREEAKDSPFAHRLTEGIYHQFELTNHSGPTGNTEVVISQKDIRELQLAKGAMMAGIRILMDRLGLREEQIREVYLAGAFGNYIRPDSASAIRLLPAFPNAKITPVGNAAGSGAKMALLSRKAFYEAVRIARRIEYVELARAPLFHQAYLEGMVFSHGPEKNEAGD